MLWIDVLNDTPLGPIWVAVGDLGLAAVAIQAQEQAFVRELGRRLGEEVRRSSPPTRPALRQIYEYLQGTRRDFELDLDWDSLSPFQQRVLKTVAGIPYGKVDTYGAIARRIGTPRAARAVGRANATNPMPLVVPCHRVVGSDGSLRGYGAPGGVVTKSWLLSLEKDRTQRPRSVEQR